MGVLDVSCTVVRTRVELYYCLNKFSQRTKKYHPKKKSPVSVLLPSAHADAAKQHESGLEEEEEEEVEDSEEEELPKQQRLSLQLKRRSLGPRRGRKWKREVGEKGEGGYK